MATSPVIADIDFAGKGKRFGHLRVPQSRNDHGWGSIPVPIVVIANGTGPTVMLTAGNHGDEYEGQVALLDLARTLDPARVQGRVILLPAMHFPAAMNGTRLSPLDNRDFNRSFPGEPFGTFALVLAHFVDSVLLAQVEVSVDIHAAGNAMEAAPSSTMHWVEDPGIVARTRALAENFAAPWNVVFWGVDEGGTMCSAAERRRVLAISTELGGYGRVSVEGVRLAERGLDNVLKWMGMVEGKPDTAQADGAPGTRHMQVRDQKGYVFAPSEGLFEPLHLPGAQVRAGQLAGWLHFIEEWARPPVPLEFRSDGFIWMAPGSGRVKKGDVVGVVMQPYAG